MPMRIAAGVIVVLMLVGTAAAGPLEEATTAYERGDYAEALKLFRPLAEQGSAEAQLVLGNMHAYGVGVEQDDVEAVKWWRRAAEQGLPTAQDIIGYLYDFGLAGLPLDDAEAFKWYQRAAENGDASAQFNLGVMLSEGHGATRDATLAHMWLSLAAAQGDEYAAKRRKEVEAGLTATQLAEAQRLAREWKPKPER